jgi:hypothetical protein
MLNIVLSHDRLESHILMPASMITTLLIHQKVFPFCHYRSPRPGNGIAFSFYHVGKRPGVFNNRSRTLWRRENFFPCRISNFAVRIYTDRTIVFRLICVIYCHEIGVITEVVWIDNPSPLRAQQVNAIYRFVTMVY